MALPGDMEEQGERARLYRFVGRAGTPLSVAQSYADTFEAHVQAGKSPAW
ncbi:hypothetical protein GWN43_03890, partial [Candidatus Bathyarchaeota archaeon]|nr:hypothetical protein [Candidatus Bathyarchaeota archaeon]